MYFLLQTNFNGKNDYVQNFSLYQKSYTEPFGC